MLGLQETREVNITFKVADGLNKHTMPVTTLVVESNGLGFHLWSSISSKLKFVGTPYPFLSLYNSPSSNVKYSVVLQVQRAFYFYFCEESDVCKYQLILNYQ